MSTTVPGGFTWTEPARQVNDVGASDGVETTLVKMNGRWVNCDVKVDAPVDWGEPTVTYRLYALCGAARVEVDAVTGRRVRARYVPGPGGGLRLSGNIFEARGVAALDGWEVTVQRNGAALSYGHVEMQCWGQEAVRQQPEMMQIDYHRDNEDNSEHHFYNLALATPQQVGPVGINNPPQRLMAVDFNNHAGGRVIMMLYDSYNAPTTNQLPNWRICVRASSTKTLGQDFFRDGLRIRWGLWVVCSADRVTWVNPAAGSECYFWLKRGMGAW